MKKTITIFVVLVMCITLFAGCSSDTDYQEVTETTTVLYVEQSGFVANIGGQLCYVICANADTVVAVNDRVQLTYWQYDHVIVLNDRTLGGYKWDTVLQNFSNLQVK